MICFEGGGSTVDWRSSPNNNLWQRVNGINNPCPTGFRLPTAAEWTAEMTSWSNQNSLGALASPLKLPFSYHRNGDGTLIHGGEVGYYWSSMVNGTNSDYLYFLSPSAVVQNTYYRAYGLSVRCVKD